MVIVQIVNAFFSFQRVCEYGNGDGNDWTQSCIQLPASLMIMRMLGDFSIAQWFWSITSGGSIFERFTPKKDDVEWIIMDFNGNHFKRVSQ